MKKSEIKFLVFMSIITLLFLFDIFIYSIFTTYSLIAFLLGAFAVAYYQFGYDKDKNRYSKDIILSVVIYCTLYYIVTYLIGLFIGFNHNVYSLTFTGIMRNIIPVALTIVISEILRYSFINRFKSNMLCMILIAVVFIFFDIDFVVKAVDYSSFKSILVNYGLFVLPSIGTNLLMTYMCYKSGFKPCVVYRLLISLPVYFLPIIPAFGDYIWSVIYLLLPFMFLLQLYLTFRKVDYNPRKEILKSKDLHKNKFTILLDIIFITIMITIVGLTSGFFKYQLIVIASGSMMPKIHVGDTVLVEKLSAEEVEKLEVGDVLVYHRDDKIIVHRICAKFKSGDETFFRTKGDNNKEPDNFLVETREVIGTTNHVVRYIGYPTVWLSERTE